MLLKKAGEMGKGGGVDEESSGVGVGQRGMAEEPRFD
jgi:hypothetical protein